MGKKPLDILLDILCGGNWTGYIGESMTQLELGVIKLFGRDGKILRNVYIPKSSGQTTEIDLLFITQKGIFVLESKNYSGWIFGDEGARSWTAMLPNKEKYQFFNPIWQNKTHIKWLREFLKTSIPMYSLIVFSERCELKKVTVCEDNTYVFKRDKTYSVIKDIWERYPDVISEKEIDGFYNALSQMTKVNCEVKQAHIKDVNNKKQEAEKTCPFCGKPLLLRTAKQGVNVGKQFYGCSGFPNCRYVKRD